MDEPKKRRKPRTFKWSRTARQTILANLNASGAELRKLITEISQQTGNPRDACLRFARQLGLKAKQQYRRWSKQVCENSLSRRTRPFECSGFPSLFGLIHTARVTTRIACIESSSSTYLKQRESCLSPRAVTFFNQDLFMICLQIVNIASRPRRYTIAS